MILATQILRETPTYPEALIGRGTAFAFQRELDAAIADFSKVDNLANLLVNETEFSSELVLLCFNRLYKLIHQLGRLGSAGVRHVLPWVISWRQVFSILLTLRWLLQIRTRFLLSITCNICINIIGFYFLDILI